MGAELVERTLTILKPDAVSSGNTGAILAHLEREGFRLAGLKRLRLSTDQARAFYAVVLLSTAMAIALDFAHVNPVKALYWTAIINGLLAPFLLVGILIVSNDRDIMHNQPSSRWSQMVVGFTTVAMFAAGIAMFVF